MAAMIAILRRGFRRIKGDKYTFDYSWLLNTYRKAGHCWAALPLTLTISTIARAARHTRLEAPSPLHPCPARFPQAAAAYLVQQ
jgi:hypothetical protein